MKHYVFAKVSGCAWGDGKNMAVGGVATRSSLKDASDKLMNQELKDEPGDGGIIAVDAKGDFAIESN